MSTLPTTSSTRWRQARTFARLDLEAADNFARAAATAGVKRIVYLGGLVPRDAATEHLLSRKETGDRLRAGTVPVTEVRAGIIVGPGSAAYEVMRDLVYHLPLMVTPKWVQSKSVADRAVESARVPAARGDDAGGRRTDPRCRRSRLFLVRDDDAAVRRGRRPAPAHPSRAGALAAAVVVLAGPRHRRPGEHRARADRRPEARHPGPRRSAAPARAPDRC